MDLQTIPWRVYAAHTLSTWGDNLWWFSGGLYMMKLNPHDLRLTALYGLVLSITVICLGSLVGHWIDKTKRLTAARTFLLVQNSSVVICVVAITSYLGVFPEDDDDTGSGPEVPLETKATTKLAVTVIVIAFSALAKLASSGTVIIMQRDWIVVIANGSNDKLAKMNSVLRTIELTTYMVAPALAGQLFSHLGYFYTGIFIGAWNVASVAVEYTLLCLIYKKYPALGQKLGSSGPVEVAGENQEGQPKETEADVEKKPMMLPDVVGPDVQPEATETTEDGGCPRMRSYLVESAKGWMLYFKHPVRNAGLGLALLYMTVLGFDNITYGYVILQKVPESVLGVLVAISALVGVLGSISFPFLRRKLGLERTGLMGMFLLVGMSVLSVVSNFLPGSPFINLVRYGVFKQAHLMEPLGDLMGRDIGQGSINGSDSEDELTTVIDEDPQVAPYGVATGWEGYISVSVLLSGIILARFGLWIVDLTVTQILQENVEEERRGIINGVQDSLNNLLDLVKCVLVIMLPSQEHFGVLIFLSFASICNGWLLYALYSRKQRGHLFHMDKLKQKLLAIF